VGTERSATEKTPRLTKCDDASKRYHTISASIYGMKPKYWIACCEGRIKRTRQAMPTLFPSPASHLTVIRAFVNVFGRSYNELERLPCDVTPDV